MNEDKLLGVTISDGQTNRQYAEYKIEYQGQDSLDQLVELADDQLLGDYFTGAIRVDQNTTETFTDSSGTQVSYNYRVIVKNNVTRDEVTAELDTASLQYDVFDFALTDKQKHIIEREDVTNNTEIDSVLADKGDLLDRALVNDSTRLPIAQAIQQLQSSDPDLAQALGNVYEVMTGETPSETTTRLSQ